MKAALYRAYGPPEIIRIEEIDPPALGEGDDERVLVQVHAAAVNPFDTLHRKGYLPVRAYNGWRKPKQPRLGIDLAGVVADVGKAVNRLKVGDPVYGIATGACAELVRARPGNLSLKPASLTFTQAAAVPTAALTALQALRDLAHLQPGQSVLVNGASGGVGHFAVQLAHWFGAEVTAVTSTANLEWVKTLGADRVLDYTREDFTRSGRIYDVILDVAAASTFYRARRALADGGVYITENPLKPGLFPALQVFASRLLRDKRAKTHLAKPDTGDLDFLTQRIDEGSVCPEIAHVFPLEQIAQAHRQMETGHTRGKLVIEIVPALGS